MNTWQKQKAQSQMTKIAHTANIMTMRKLNSYTKFKKTEWVIPYQVMQAWTWPISAFDKNLPSCYNM